MNHTLDVQFRGERFTTDQVLEFREFLHCGRPAELTARVLLPQALDLDELLGTRASLRVLDGSLVRSFYGVIEAAELEANPQEEGNFVRPTYRVRVVSHLALLARSVDCRIFQDQSVPQIVEAVLADHGISGDTVAWRLRASYPTREYCVQYRESALHFVSRLLESEGIYFFSEADDEAELERIVFADHSPSSLAAPEAPLPLRSASSLHSAGAAVYRSEEVHAARSGKVTVRSYDFKRPDLDLTCSAQADVLTELELYEYSADFTEPSDGERLSTIRLEEVQWQRRRERIVADSPEISAGRLLSIDDGERTVEYFVVASEHRYSHDRRSREAERSGDVYRVRAELIPSDVCFRPARIHQPPRIHGPQTATVVAPSGAELESIHTDEHARCKVRFHWDRAGEFYENASCWMRVGQLQTSGSMALPRVHWEVLVEFVGGNPDHPIVTGRLYNGTFAPPYALPEGRTRTSIQSASTPAGGGRNEIRFEDKAGAEEILIHSQYDTAIAAANNRAQTVGKDATLTIGNNAALTVGADQSIQVTRGLEESIGGDQSVTIGANRTIGVNAVYGLTVAGDAHTSVGGNLFEMNGNPLEAVLTLAASRAVAVASAEASRVAAQVQGAVQGAVNQALGPLTQLQSSVNALGSSMVAVSNGSLDASVGVMAGASALPSFDALSRSMAAGPAATRTGPEDDASAGGISGAAVLNAAMTGALRDAVRGVLGESSGTDGAGSRGSSEANRAGPAGDLGGFSESDLTQGPGYAEYQVTGSQSEDVAAMRLTAAAGSVMYNAVSASESVGAAHIELIKGSRAESVEGASSETAPAMVVVVGGGQSESVKGALLSQVAGAVIRKVGGDRTVSSSGALSLAAAAHQIEASSKLTLKCGGSTIVIDGGGIIIEAPLVTISAGKVELPKNVNDG